MLHPALRPAASILDPTLTYTVSAYQTAAGTVDIMSHTLEGYFTNKPGGYLQCRMAEGLLRTCIHYGPIALAKPDDYEARANLMWAGSWALEGVLRLGQAVPSTVHPIEHQLSAYYDVTHAAGLAVLTPAWMDYVLSDRTVDKFKEYAVNVWGVDPALERYQAAQEGIARTRRFFIDLKMPTTLRELGIGTEKFAVMAENCLLYTSG